MNTSLAMRAIPWLMGLVSPKTTSVSPGCKPKVSGLFRQHDLAPLTDGNHSKDVFVAGRNGQTLLLRIVAHQVNEGNLKEIGQSLAV